MSKKKIGKTTTSFNLENTSFIGIKNSSESYHFVYNFNKVCDTKMAKEIDFEFYDDSENMSYRYPIYLYIDEAYDLTYFLVQTCVNNKLMHQAVQFYDKILLITGRDHATVAADISSKCFEIPDTFCSDYITFEESLDQKIKGKSKKALQNFLEKGLFLDMDSYFSRRNQESGSESTNDSGDVFFQY